MRTLYLLRHAQAASALSGEDKDRPLSPHGIGQAKSVAPYLKNIDVALCSSSKRTKMTLNNAIDAGAAVKKIEYLDSLYNAAFGDLLTCLQSAKGDKVLIVAHNPGIHQLAHNLVGDGDTIMRETIKLSYPPATLSVIECALDDWSNIQLQANKLIDVIIPD